MLRAHRVAFSLVNGPIPPGKCICHSCDNPSCCNPDHLYLGSRADNNKDRVARGRQAWGERMPSAKLSAEQVHDIRSKYAEQHVSQRALGREYGVSHTVIWQIVHRAKWARVE